MIIINVFKRLVYIMWVIKTSIFYKPFFKVCGKRVIIIKPILITKKFISLGNKILIRNFARIEGIDFYQGIFYQPEIIIGNFVSIEQNLHLTCAKKIIIGSNTSIAANVTITDIDHGYEDIETPPEKQPLIVNSVIIGEDCKIFNNAVLLAGTQLGKHTIVAANAVVRGKFPNNCVIGGIPAKIIKLYNNQNNCWERV